MLLSPPLEIMLTVNCYKIKTPIYLHLYEWTKYCLNMKIAFVTILHVMFTLEENFTLYIESVFLHATTK